MQRLALGPLVYEFTRHAAPRITIPSGETIVVETEDAFSGQIRTNDDRRDRAKMPYSNPLTGPIVVENAEPGDSLAVTIHEIQPLIGQCATRTSDPKQLAEWLGDDCPHGVHVCPIRDGLVHWSEKIALPYRPMLGCLGVAPHWGSPTTLPTGPYGGNMDLLEVAPGSTIHLPVLTSGGYLYLGDAHAAMGHGELSASGLEMPAETTLTVRLMKQRRLPGVRIETADEIFCVATGTPMERSIAEASARLIQWLEADFGWNRWRAFDLLTHTARISTGYYGIGTVGVGIGKKWAESAT